jgi:hypothetical protein
MRIVAHARRSALLAAVLTVVVMLFAGSSFGPSVADGAAAKLVVTVLNAPTYLLNLEAPPFRESPALAIGAIAALEFLYFLALIVAVRACLDSLRARRAPEDGRGPPR